MAPFALLAPQKSLPAIARTFAAVAARATKPRAGLSRFRHAVLGPALSTSGARDLHRDAIACQLLDSLYLLRCYRPGGWRPKVRIDGIEHIETALSEGRGALLWVMPFRFSDLVTKIALAEAGFAVEHLSRFSHPGSNTRYGCSFLNPVRTNIERRHLARRLVIARDHRVDSRPTLEVLADRLNANTVVSITVGLYGRQTQPAPLANGEINFATGPAYLALSNQTPMLPVFTVAERPGEFRLTIGEPLDDGGHHDRADRITALLHDEATRLADYAVNYPEQFPWGHFVKT